MILNRVADYLELATAWCRAIYYLRGRAPHPKEYGGFGLHIIRQDQVAGWRERLQNTRAQLLALLALGVASALLGEVDALKVAALGVVLYVLLDGLTYFIGQVFVRTEGTRSDIYLSSEFSQQYRAWIPGGEP